MSLQFPAKLEEGRIYSASCFIDSGAHSLYNIHVLGSQKKQVGKHGRPLAAAPVKWGRGDFSHYSLKEGSEFRQYCDEYATFIKKIHRKDPSVLFANVDVISHPEMTWQVQCYFEKEHGVFPIPIVHCDTPMKYVDRYLNVVEERNGERCRRYDLLGVGGLGQGVSRDVYFSWADRFFCHICPPPTHMPVVRTHGFAMTSWELLCRYPWWSVDSATWVKLSAYGWLYVPRWSDSKGWRFDKPPMMINFSARPPKNSEASALAMLPDPERTPAPREAERFRHFNNSLPEVQRVCLKWLEAIDIKMGKFDKEGNVLEDGVSVHHRPRSIANLIYMKLLERSRPRWPHPLDHNVVERDAAAFGHGFGL